MHQVLFFHNLAVTKMKKSLALSRKCSRCSSISQSSSNNMSPSDEYWQYLCLCAQQATGVSYSCVVRIQSVPPAQGKGHQRWPAARECSVCGGEHHLWSRDPDTNPRMTRETPHSPVVFLC